MENDKLRVINGVSRKKFLKFAGLSAATVASFGIISCKDGLTDVASSNNSSNDSLFSSELDDERVNLGSGDVGILNYAYTIEQLEARFYRIVLDNRYSGMSDSELILLGDICEHEAAHRDFLRAAIPQDAIIPDLTFNFDTIDFDSRDSVLRAAQIFEDGGVSAYNGAGQLLENPEFLLQAGKIVSVEARHAAAIRSMIGDSNMAFAGDDIIDENGLDIVRTPDEVIALAQGFIVEEINGSNLPQS
ncbi:hypothetical protein BH23BAC3_BH23BAC3_23530 [soil metagenome]